MNDKAHPHSSQIRINVGLDENRVPIHIDWEADDQSGQGPQDCKAFMLSLFERQTKETLRIDLWTQDMQVAEMDRLMFHTLRSMADSYLRASNNVELARHFQAFAHHFGEQTGIIAPEAQ
jgi:gliding motility-associated protein GldC